MSYKHLINPPHLAPPRGFTHGIMVEGGRLLFLAGQDGSNGEGRITAPGDLVAQYEQAVRNVQAVLAAAGGTLQDIVRLTIYVTDCPAYRAHLRRIGEVHRAHFGRYYPAAALVEVKSLFHDEALVELEAIAVIG